MSDLTPVEKFKVALQLHEAGVRMHEQTLRRRHPGASDEQIAELVLKWLTRQPEVRGLSVREVRHW